MEVTIQRVVATKVFETRDKALQTVSALVGDNFKVNKINEKWFATYEKEVHTIMDGECTTVEDSEPTDCLGGGVKDSPQVEQ